MREVLQIDFPVRESGCGWGIVIAYVCGATRSVELMREGKDGTGVRARGHARECYLRRNSSEISLETERNTSTARAPIMPKAIIIFSGRI
jgi:hypothetical protein